MTDAAISPDPDWLTALRDACAARSQAAVAREVGVSRTTVSLVLSGRYPADHAAVAQRVRDTLMGDAPVACPGLGETITAAACADWRAKARALVATSSQRVAMYRACRACPHNPEREG